MSSNNLFMHTYNGSAKKSEIANYWLLGEGSYEFPFLAEHLDFNSPCCFACQRPVTGFKHAGEADHSSVAALRWNSNASLERAHIASRRSGGNDSCDNLMLLCKQCHKDAPMTNLRREMFQFIESRKIWYITYLEPIQDIMISIESGLVRKLQDFEVEEIRVKIRDAMEFVVGEPHLGSHSPATYKAAFAAMLWKLQ